MDFDSEKGVFIIKFSGAEYNITRDDKLYPIGAGAFSNVYKATDKHGNTYSVKEIDKTNPGITPSQAQKEVEIIKKIPNHPRNHVMHLVDYIDSEKMIYLLLPHYDGDTLSSLIHKNCIHTEREALYYFKQICAGVKLLHDLSIIHRDIKTDNILYKKIATNYGEAYDLVISDYGSSKFVSDPNNTSNVGTLYTSAPESKNFIYSLKSDVYSLGCIYYKILTSKEHNQGNNECEITESKSTIKDVVTTLNNEPISFASKNILHRCLQFDPANRISSTELYNLLSLNSFENDVETFTKECSYKCYSPKIPFTIAPIKEEECKNIAKESTHSKNLSIITTSSINIVPHSNIPNSKKVRVISTYSNANIAMKLKLDMQSPSANAKHSKLITQANDHKYSNSTPSHKSIISDRSIKIAYNTSVHTSPKKVKKLIDADLNASISNDGGRWFKMHVVLKPSMLTIFHKDQEHNLILNKATKVLDRLIIDNKKIIEIGNNGINRFRLSYEGKEELAKWKEMIEIAKGQ